MVGKVHTISVLSNKRRSKFSSAMKLISFGAVCLVIYFFALPHGNGAADKKSDELVVTKKVINLFQLCNIFCI